MGKAVAYLVVVIFGVFLWSYTGLFDGMFSRGNLEERTKFWEATVAREAPKGTPKGMVDALVARHGMSLECFNSAATPPVAECIADVPARKLERHVIRWPFRFDLFFGVRPWRNSNQLHMYCNRVGGKNNQKVSLNEEGKGHPIVQWDALSTTARRHCRR